jgi:hypothetical protein
MLAHLNYLRRFAAIILVGGAASSVSGSAALAQWYGGWGWRGAPWGWSVPRPYYPPRPAYYFGRPPYYPGPSYYSPPPAYSPYWGYRPPEYYWPSYNPAAGNG